jgi:site-specific recombinase XerD
VEALLCSIDRSEPHGLRDFTLLYLAAAYGLRSSELVRLTLDDIDWRGCSLMLAGRKNKHAIRLPMTDETANILITYLRNARPDHPHCLRHSAAVQLLRSGVDLSTIPAWV